MNAFGGYVGKGSLNSQGGQGTFGGKVRPKGK